MKELTVSPEPELFLSISISSPGERRSGACCAGRAYGSSFDHNDCSPGDDESAAR